MTATTQTPQHPTPDLHAAHHPAPARASSAVPPPNRHQLTFMIWLSVFPTLVVLNLVLADWLRTLPPVLRTFSLVTMAIPIVNYVLMPQLHRLRARLVRRGVRAVAPALPAVAA